MKALRRIPAVFIFVFISALFSAAQQAPQSSLASPQKPSVIAANRIQLVIEGKVLNVHDGDTVTVVDEDGKKFHIRLAGIDAPELKQEVGPVSQQNLSRMVLGKQVSIYWSKIDKYRRTVGTIMLDGRDVNIEQVKAGLAWHFKKYEDEQPPEDRRTYAGAEQAARAAKLGLWKEEAPLAPGDWRQAVKTKRWGPPPPEGTIIGNSNSKKYHRPDCTGYRDMAEKNRVFFKTVAEAEEAGYKRAGNCPAEMQTSSAKPAVAASMSASASSSASISIAKPATSTSSPKPPPLQPAFKGTPKAVPANAHQLAASASQGVVIGNKNSRVYHLPGCSGYSSVLEKNQVRFQSPEEAEKAGFRLAGNCSVKKIAATSRN
jgi:endonuclease YncB( thermonuclease family)/methylphosphotriester-DNA--protein-cysteine methyltransferase